MEPRFFIVSHYEIEDFLFVVGKLGNVLVCKVEVFAIVALYGQVALHYGSFGMISGTFNESFYAVGCDFIVAVEEEYVVAAGSSYACVACCRKSFVRVVFEP